MIVFENGGEIDIAAMTTFGVSVKIGDSPIGFFGTGLKYAIAVLLRTGCRIMVFSGEQEMRFSTRRGNIRGKDFEFVEMAVGDGVPAPIGFTTELGKNWQPWMAYRELYCNTRDEGGEVYMAASASAATDPRRDFTQIRVEGAEIESVHRSHDEYFISGEPDLTIKDVAIYRRPSSALFYRGVRVLTLPKRAVFTYNLTGHVELTEDRTMAHPFMAQYYLRRALAKCDDPDILEAALTASSDDFERDFDYTSDGDRPSDAFLSTAGRLADVASGSLVPSALNVWNATRPRTFRPQVTPLTAAQVDTVARVRQRAQRAGLDRRPIVVADAIPDGAPGIVVDGTLYIAARLLGDEAAILRSVLYQQSQSAADDDPSREPIDFLLDALTVELGAVAA
ncbi:MAG: hypothetical protein WDN25_13175 [Acetobacteraceae bacterium]